MTLSGGSFTGIFVSPGRHIYIYIYNEYLKQIVCRRTRWKIAFASISSLSLSPTINVFPFLSFLFLFLFTFSFLTSTRLIVFESCFCSLYTWRQPYRRGGGTCIFRSLLMNDPCRKLETVHVIAGTPNLRNIFFSPVIKIWLKPKPLRWTWFSCSKKQNEVYKKVEDRKKYETQLYRKAGQSNGPILKVQWFYGKMYD